MNREFAVSSRTWLVVPTLALLCATSALVRSASASTIAVPPVTITQLTHSVSGGSASDAVAFPDGTVLSDGFSAALATGDTINIRFQAPPGMKFVVHGGHGQPGLPEEFFVSGDWRAGFDLALRNSPYTLAFEDLAGPAPTVAPQACGVSNHGLQIFVNFIFFVATDYEFSALDIQVINATPLTPTLFEYPGVRGLDVPSFGTRAPTPDATLMEIVPTAIVPANTTSWGRVKRLYR